MSEKRAKRKLSKKKKILAMVDLLEEKSTQANSDSPEQMLEGESTPCESKRQKLDGKTKEDVDEEIKSAYRKLLEMKKEGANYQPARFYVDVSYLSRRRKKLLLFENEVDPVKSPVSIYACDVQSFIMYSVFKRNSFYQPRWCSVQYVSSIKQMVVLVLEGVCWLDIYVSQPSLWKAANIYLSQNSVRIKASCLYQSELEEDLFMVALPLNEVANKCNGGDVELKCRKECITPEDDHVFDSEALLSCEDVFQRTMLLLPFPELVSEGFPLPDYAFLADQEEAFSSFAYSKDFYTKVTDRSPLYAIDCEMVLTVDHRMSLACVCVVDEMLNVVYKTLVKPSKKVKDYLTKYSGITEEHLLNVDITLQDVQRKLNELLPPDAILCGHSLNCDLSALKLYHPYIIDTSVCYNLKGMKYSKSALRTLATHFLKKEIQTSNSGHCPEEDAITAMQLVLLKMKVGFTFGNVLVDGLTLTPSKFFKKPGELPRKDSLHPDSKANSPRTVNPSHSEPPHTHLPSLSTGTNNTEYPQSCRDANVIDMPSPTQEKDDNVEKYKGSYAFCRKNIPQLEVNMFDMIGQFDNNTAAICCQESALIIPQTRESIKMTICKKSASTIAAVIDAVKDNHNFVYGKLSPPKSKSPKGLKKHAKKTDDHIQNLWNSLPSGTLMCVIASGTDCLPGVVMFNTKYSEEKTVVLDDRSSSISADDVYADVYGYS